MAKTTAEERAPGRAPWGADLSGRKFGSWLVLRLAPREKPGAGRKWLCRCTCGEERLVTPSVLWLGKSTQCNLCALRGRAKHGLARTGKMTPEYKAWQQMVRRCRPGDRNFARYGARGIDVCDEWKRSPEAFIAYVGPKPSPKHSIDRINNDGNYEPGNVRWATPTEQARNTRNNRRLTIRGETLCLAEWAVRGKVDKVTIRSRLARGFTHEEAVYGRR